MRDAGEQLKTALLARAGGGSRLLSMRSKAWMSVNLDGRRHRLAIEMPGDATAGFCAGIGETEFALRDHFVASITAAATAGRVEIEALTISETQ